MVLVVAGCDAAEVLDAIEEALDEIALAIEHRAVNLRHIRIQGNHFRFGFQTRRSNAIEKGKTVCGLARKEWRAFLRLCGFGLEAAWAFIAEGGMPPDGMIEAVDIASKGDFGLGA